MAMKMQRREKGRGQVRFVSWRHLAGRLFRLPEEESATAPEQLASIAEVLRWAKQEGVLEAVILDDDDVLPPMTETRWDGKVVTEAAKVVKSTGLEVVAVTCAFDRSLRFQGGALTNPNAEIRREALAKLRRSMELGRMLKASFCNVSLNAEDFATPLNVDWKRCWEWLVEGLNAVSAAARRGGAHGFKGGGLGLGMNRAGFQPFVSTMADALSLSLHGLKETAFWNVFPNSLNSNDLKQQIGELSRLALLRKLPCLPLGELTQTGRHLREEAVLLWILERLGWSGAYGIGGPAPWHAPLGVEAVQEWLANNACSLTILQNLKVRLDGDWGNDLGENDLEMMASVRLAGLDIDAIVQKTIRRDAAPSMEKAESDEKVTAVEAVETSADQSSVEEPEAPMEEESMAEASMEDESDSDQEDTQVIDNQVDACFDETSGAEPEPLPEPESKTESAESKKPETDVTDERPRLRFANRRRMGENRNRNGGRGRNNRRAASNNRNRRRQKP